MYIEDFGIAKQNEYLMFPETDAFDRYRWESFVNCWISQFSFRIHVYNDILGEWEKIQNSTCL